MHLNHWVFSTAVRFIAGGAQFIKDTSQLEIFNNKLYDEVDGKFGPAPFGPLDLRLVSLDISLPHTVAFFD